jgi:NAD(P)-dependent dehydrogenase (short-subunit alcohol dehydrogenase family)
MPDAKQLLAGKVAIVTGAGRGIGRGVALAFAFEGAKVVVCERKEPYLTQTVGAITAAGGVALASETDVRDGAQVRAMVARTVAEFGGVDVLVNNVGGIFLGRGRPVSAPFLELSEADWDDSYALNLKTAFYCTAECGRVMVEQGRGGSIINVSSSEAMRGVPGFAPYGAYKGAIANFTKSLALELAPHNIRVNCIAPDGVATEGLASEGAGDGSLWAHIPLGRAATPAEVAGAFVFLASDMSGWVTGVTLPVDGGIIAASGWVRAPDGEWRLSSQG